MPVPSENVPAWIQVFIVAAGSLAVFVGTLLKYIKKEKPPEANPQVIAGAIFDAVSMRDLRDELRENRAEMREHRHCLTDLAEATRENSRMMRREK